MDDPFVIAPIAIVCDADVCLLLRGQAESTPCSFHYVLGPRMPYRILTRILVHHTVPRHSDTISDKAELVSFDTRPDSNWWLNLTNVVTNAGFFSLTCFVESTTECPQQLNGKSDNFLSPASPPAHVISTSRCPRHIIQFLRSRLSLLTIIVTQGAASTDACK